ncbi:MAG: transcriptional regulator [Negativicutes bacterium]
MNSELKKYIPIANMIAKTFGKQCEVVIHDLSIPQNSVVYTLNNHVTGRQIGQPFEHLVKEVLLSKNFDGDCTANYMTVIKDGREIKSSTTLLRDSGGKPIGALCINLDVKPLKDAMSFMGDLLNVEQAKPEVEVEPFSNVMEIVDDLIDKIIDQDNVDNLKRKDKLDLIQFMDDKGVFLIKGAIDKVAERLNISKVTVYSYLDEIKKAADN